MLVVRHRYELRPPCSLAPVWAHLSRHATPGVDSVRLGDAGHASAASSCWLPGGPAVAVAHADRTWLDVTLAVSGTEDLPDLERRAGVWFDLDCRPDEVDAALGRDERLRPLVTAVPGIRVAGSLDAADLALRTVLGQQISIAAAVTHHRRFVDRFGEPLPSSLAEVAAEGGHTLTHTPPRIPAVAAADPETLAVPRSRARAVVGLARALTDGLDLDRDVDLVRTELKALPGIGPWTSGYVALRGLGATDIELPTDLVARRATAAVGLADLDHLSPWRSYATVHLWHAWATGALS